MKVLTVIIMGLLVSPALTAGGSGAAAVEFSLARKQETGFFHLAPAFLSGLRRAAGDPCAAAGLAGTGEASGRVSYASQDVEPKPVSLAERYLFELALESKQARKRRGYVYLGTGAVLMAGGLVMIAGDNKDTWGDVFLVGLGAMTLTVAGGAILGGIGTLNVASGPERKYKVVNSLPDALHREQASREALFSLARSRRTRRYISAGIFSALAVHGLIGTSDPESALFPGAFAVYKFLRKSREEKIYARFLEAGGIPPERINVSFGPGPRGGLRMVLTASF